MITKAKFKSVKTKEGIKVFRYETVFESEKGPGEVIGLVYMMNPGDARPESDKLFTTLQRSEFQTPHHVPTNPDRTMAKVMKLLELAFESNNIKLPEKYTIHVENLFNIREKKSKVAAAMATRLTDVSAIMFQSRKFSSHYDFVWLAWGKVKIESKKQKRVLEQFPKAVKVFKRRYGGEIRVVDYPIHPLYVNRDFFFEAFKQKMERDDA